MQFSVRLVAAIALVGISASVSMAQLGDGGKSTSFQSEHFEPAGNQGSNLLSVTSSRLLPHLMPSAGLFLHYAKDPLVLYRRDANDPDNEVLAEKLIETQLIGDIWVSMGLLDWLNFNLHIPVTLFMAGADLGSSFGKAGVSVGGAAMGDLRFSTKLQITNWADTGGFGLAVQAEVWFPTGDTDTWRGDGEFRFQPKLILEYRSEGGFSLVANVAYQLRPKRVSQNIISDDVLRWAVGLEIPTVPEMQILVTALGNLQFDEDVNPYSGVVDNKSRNTPIDIVAAFQFKLPAELVLQVGGGLGLTRAAGSPEARALLSIGYTPDPRDTDRDGLRDAVDKCPFQPEDLDNYQDDDGCPELDNDHDGILDADDKCPMIKEDLDKWEDTDGCPDPDNDKDGFLDPDDKCPNQPEDKDGFEDTDGCPDPDNDKDGILDTDDKCPDKAEDKDGFEDTDGCPDPDNDKDGILDVTDKCPNKPETKNGFQDFDGCPDKKPKPKPKIKPGKVKVTKTKIEIADKVFFKSGKAVIKPVSYPLLREVAAVVNAHPAITKIRIEGHTDSRGKAGYNKKLSRARAAAVRMFLEHEGVSPSRLSSEGFGEDKPIASNKKGKGRAKNRRVEFTIMEVDGKPVGPGPVEVPTGK